MQADTRGGAFGLPISLPTTSPTSLDAAKQQALDAAKQQAQGAASSVMGSDAVKAGLDKAQGAANSVGLGDQFAAAKDAAINKIESVTGLTLSGPTGCPPERIDVPSVSDVLVATADTPYEATTTMDSFFSYVVVDSRNPPDTAATQKSRLWYISIANTIFLISLGIMYGQINK